MKKSSEYALGAIFPLIGAICLLLHNPGKQIVRPEITKPAQAFTAAGKRQGNNMANPQIAQGATGAVTLTGPSGITAGFISWSIKKSDGTLIASASSNSGGQGNTASNGYNLNASQYYSTPYPVSITANVTLPAGATVQAGDIATFVMGDNSTFSGPFDVTAAPVADNTAPVVNGSPTVNAAGTQIAVSWTEAANPPVLQASGKGATQGVTLSGFSGGAVTVTGSTTAGLVTTLTLSRTIYSGETGGLLSIAAGSYTDSAATPNATAAVSNAAITNSSTTAAPVAAPSAPVAPVVSGVTAYGASVAIPPLAGGATSYNLQYAPDVSGSPGNFNTIAPNVPASSSVAVSGLSPLSSGYFRLVAVNSGGQTAGTSTGKVTTTLGTERGTVFQGLQWGVETTPGVIVPATKRILSLQTDPEPIIPVSTYRPYGNKSYTETQSGQEMTEANFSGILDFMTMPYLLAAHIGNAPAAPVTLSGGAYQWDFLLNETTPNTPTTLSCEVGGSQGASRFGYGFIPDLDMTFAKEEASITGKIIGQLLGDNITITPNCPELPAVAMPPKLARISLGTAPGSLTKLTRVISAKVTMTGHFVPAFFRDDTAASYSGIVEKAPDYMFQIVNELGSDTDALLAGLRNDTLFYLQVMVTGNLIGSGVYNSFYITMPVKVQKQPTREDHDGVYGATYDFIGAHDPTFGAAQARVVCKLASL